MNGLIPGVLDNSRRIGAPGVAARVRGLTLDAARFKHSGAIVEDADLGSLLARARGAGGRYCLVQDHGHGAVRLYKATSPGGPFAPVPPG